MIRYGLDNEKEAEKLDAKLVEMGLESLSYLDKAYIGGHKRTFVKNLQTFDINLQKIKEFYISERNGVLFKATEELIALNKIRKLMFSTSEIRFELVLNLPNKRTRIKTMLDNFGGIAMDAATNKSLFEEFKKLGYHEEMIEVEIIEKFNMEQASQKMVDLIRKADGRIKENEKTIEDDLNKRLLEEIQKITVEVG